MSKISKKWGIQFDALTTQELREYIKDIRADNKQLQKEKYQFLKRNTKNSELNQELYYMIMGIISKRNEKILGKKRKLITNSEQSK